MRENKNLFNTVAYMQWLVFFFALLLYVNTFSHDYAQDDSIVITDNMFTQQGLAGISSIFSTDAFFGFFKKQGKANLVQGGRYRPLSIASFAVEQELFKGNPSISHVINVLLYAFICLFFFRLMVNLLGRVYEDKQQVMFLALAMSLLFASHPVHTEVVANIKGRDELFVLLFGILSTYFFYKKERTVKQVVIAYLFFALAIFSKENAIVWLFIIPISSWFFSRNSGQKKDWLFSIGFVLITIIFLLVRSSILGSGISEATTELMNNPFLKFDGSRMIPFDFSETWGSIAYQMGKYIQLLFYPVNLTSDYYPYQLGIHTLNEPIVIFSIFIHLVLLIYSIYGFTKKHVAAYGILVYFAAIFLISNIPFSIGTTISERFLFFPSLGFCVSIVMGVYFLLARAKKRNILSYLILGPVLLFFSFQTITRNPVWKNDETLLLHDVEISTESAKANHGAAGALSEKAGKLPDGPEKTSIAQKSNEYIRKALEIYPLYSNAYLIQGNNYFYQKDYAKAISSYEILLKLYPENEQGIRNLSIVLRDYGRHQGEKLGNIEQATSLLLRASELNPTDYETMRLLATSYGIQSEHELALKYFIKARDLKPKEAYAWLNLSKVYQILGQESNAQESLREAKTLDPNINN